MRINSKFLRDIGSLNLAGNLSQISQLGSTVALAFLLGSHGQGLMIAAISLHAFGHCLLSIGVPQVTTSQISANAARGRDDKVASWIAFMAKSNLFFGLWMLAIGYFIFPFLAEHWLEEPQVGVWAWWLCAGPLLELPRDVVRVALQGTRRMRALGSVENGHEFVRFLFVVVGAILMGDARGAIIGSLCAGAFGSMLALFVYQAAQSDGQAPLPRVREVLARLRDIPLRKGLRQGVRIAAFKNLHSLVFLVLPKLIIQATAGSSSVAYFNLAQRLMSIPQVFSTAISRTALPALGEVAGQRDGARFRRIFAKTTLASGFAMTAAIAIGLVLIPFFLVILFDPDYAEPVMRFAKILAIAEITAAFCVCLEAFFISTNQMKALLGLAILSLATAVPAAAWLITEVPVTGTAWSVVALRLGNLFQLGFVLVFLWGSGRRDDYWSKSTT